MSTEVELSLTKVMTVMGKKKEATERRREIAGREIGEDKVHPLTPKGEEGEGRE